MSLLLYQLSVFSVPSLQHSISETIMPIHVEEPERELSEYEKKRLERIRKNEEHMKRLGLDKFKDLMKRKCKSLSGKAKEAKRTKTKTKKTKARTAKARVAPIRKSARIACNGTTVTKKEKLVMLDYNQTDGVERVCAQDTNVVAEDGRPEHIVSYTTTNYRRPRKKLNVDVEKCTLLDEEKEVLEKGINENFLSKFREFLQYHDKISEQNLRNVMRQIRKLASGDGIRYESPRYGWPEDCYFKRGEKISPLSDIVQLMIEAQECEDRWGRDHGNGWLLSHPLKKLLLFQQFALNNPSFLNAECKLEEYYDED